MIGTLLAMRYIVGFDTDKECVLTSRQLTNGCNDQYPSLLSMRRRSNTALPGEAFVDLHHQDFISVAGRVSHHKLKWLVLGPYQMVVLCQGVL